MQPEKRSNREHAFDTELAVIVGIEKAILLKNIDFWCTENEIKKNSFYFVLGTWWTSESLNSLARKYPYMKKGNLSRWLHQMQVDGWIRIHVGEKGNNFYAPGPVFIAWDTGQNWQEVFQNETGGGFKMKQEVFQNETGGGFKMKQGVFQNETHINSEINSEKDNSDLYSEISAQNALLAGFVDAPIKEDPLKINPPLPPPGRRAAKPKAGEYTERDVAKELTMPEQVFYSEVLKNGAWPDYLLYRKTQHGFRYKEPKSQALAVKNLINLTNNRPEEAQRFVDHARLSGWKGLFPIKEQNNAARQQNGAFVPTHVAEQRNTAMAIYANGIAVSKKWLDS